MKGDKDYLPIHDSAVIEGGGSYKGFEYLITFTINGSRCGYVAIPDGVGVNSDDIFCHGGITFEERDHGAKDLLPLPCNDLWLGFDAAHYGDMFNYETTKKYFGHNPDRLKEIEVREELHKPIHELELKDHFSSHKQYDFMENECKEIIDQIIEGFKNE